MSLVVEERYPNGVPQTAVPGFSPPGVGWHWTAGGRGRAGWDGTVTHLVNTRYTTNASYHGGFWVEHGPGHVGCRTVVQWIVPTTSAAHSVNPGDSWKYSASKPLATQNARFAEVRRILGAKASDPNAAMIAMAYAGMPADLELDLACPIFRADVRELAQQLVAHPATVEAPHFGHGWIQPLTRYEMDVATDFIGLLYGEGPQTPEEADMKFTEPVKVQRWRTRTGPQSAFLRPDGSTGVFVESEEVVSFAEGRLPGGIPGYPAINDNENVRVLDYGDVHQPIIIRRYGMDPIAPPLIGIPTGGLTQAALDAARDAALRQGRTEGADGVLEAAKTKAATYGAS